MADIKPPEINKVVLSGWVQNRPDYIESRGNRAATAKFTISIARHMTHRGRKEKRITEVPVVVQGAQAKEAAKLSHNDIVVIDGFLWYGVIRLEEMPDRRIELYAESFECLGKAPDESPF